MLEYSSIDNEDDDPIFFWFFLGISEPFFSIKEREGEANL